MVVLPENEFITENTIINGMRNVGIEDGDTLLVHIDTSSWQNLSGASDWLTSLNNLKKYLLSGLGKNGNLIVPTFNYDFCKGIEYNHNKSISQVGMFTNIVLADPLSTRSLHPIFSFAGIGPGILELFSDISNSSFGQDSVFHRLYEVKAKMFFFNVSFEFCTFIHYVEQREEVDYRYLKKFSGQLTVDQRTYNDTFDYNVRPLYNNIETDLTSLEKYLVDKGKLIRKEIDKDLYISSVSCEDVYNAAKKKLREDERFLIKRT